MRTLSYATWLLVFATVAWVIFVFQDSKNDADAVVVFVPLKEEIVPPALAPTPPPPPQQPQHTPSPPPARRYHTILVLGSSGPLGRALVQTLRQMEYSVVEVRGRHDVDLRRKEFTGLFKDTVFDFAFYLAFEKGNRHFFPYTSDRMVETHNRDMYDNVFPFLAQRNTPFIFTSMMPSENTAPVAARMKAEGENRSLKAGGKVVRLRDLLGPEPIAPNMAPMTRLVFQCASQGTASVVIEQTPQHLSHVNDTSRALVHFMEDYKEMAQTVSLDTMGALGYEEMVDAVAAEFGQDCTISRLYDATTNNQSAAAAATAPGGVTTALEPLVSLDGTIRELKSFYTHLVADFNKRCREEPYLSVVLASRDDNYGSGMAQRIAISMRHLVHYATMYYLPFEVVIGEYNFRPNRDQPMAHSSALVPGGFYRIVTVPQAVHLSLKNRSAEWAAKTTPDEFFEYTAKNVAGRRARGQFVAITNPDDIFPEALIAAISRQNLVRDNVVYRCIRSPDMNAAHASGVDELENGFRKNNMYGMLKSSPPKQGMDDAYLDCSGDFIMMSRESFIAKGGFLELPLTSHLDSIGLLRFLCPRFPYSRQIVLDVLTFHQQHARRHHVTPSLETLIRKHGCGQKPDNPENWGFFDDPRVITTIVDKLNTTME